MDEWSTVDTGVRGTVPLRDLANGDEIQWYHDGVRQLREKFRRPTLLASRYTHLRAKILRDNQGDPAVPVILAAASIIEFQPHDEEFPSPMRTYVMDALKHLSSTSPRSLDPLARWVLESRFPSGGMSVEADDHEACVEFLELFGRCLDNAPSQVGEDGFEYSSHEVEVRLHSLPQEVKFPQFALATWERELLYPFDASLSEEDHRSGLVKMFEEDLKRELRHSVKSFLNALIEEFGGDPHRRGVGAVDNSEGEINVGSTLVNQGEFRNFLLALCDDEIFLDVASQEENIIFSALEKLFTIYQEYNLEWALAALDWHGVVRADVDAWIRRNSGAPLAG